MLPQSSFIKSCVGQKIASAIYIEICKWIREREASRADEGQRRRGNDGGMSPDSSEKIMNSNR